MGLEKIGLRAVALAAAIVLAAACETAVQEEAESAGTGAAATTTTTAAAATTAQRVIPGSQEDLVLNVGDRVFFDFDKSNIRPDARATIERWAAWLKQFPDVTVTIEGHADERGTREYNLGLGERRANAAFNVLVALGVQSDRIGTISYGKERPVCTTSNEGCWSQNRRGVLVVN